MTQRKADTRSPAYAAGMARTFPILPAQPHRICWGCDRYCSADAMLCGNGSVRTPHPSELFGPDWQASALPEAAPDQGLPTPPLGEPGQRP